MTLTQILQKIRNAFYTKSEIDSMGGGTSLSDTISQKADKSDLSNYLPREDRGYKIIGGNGKYLWCKFATITINSAYVNYPICFEVVSRDRLKSNLQVRFANANSSDPTLDLFITDNDTNFYIKKVSTGTWELYHLYNDIWGLLTIYRVVNDVKGGSSVTINTTLVNLEEEPTDKIQCSLHSEGIEEQGEGYIRYSSGIQICWGVSDVIECNVGSTVYFTISYKAFNSSPSLSLTRSYVGTGWAQLQCTVTSLTTTYAKVGVFNNSTENKSAQSKYIWQAIGRWK